MNNTAEQTEVIRGAQAIADYLNAMIVGGEPLTRAAVYRMIEDGRIPATRLGRGRTEVWAHKADLDQLFSRTERKVA